MKNLALYASVCWVSLSLLFATYVVTPFSFWEESIYLLILPLLTPVLDSHWELPNYSPEDPTILSLSMIAAVGIGVKWQRKTIGQVVGFLGVTLWFAWSTYFLWVSRYLGISQ